MSALPPELGHEIALTGSAARGTADERSDIEINSWLDEISPPNRRAAWLRDVGATDIILDAEPIADGSAWAECRFQGFWLEIGWQSFAAQRELLTLLCAGEIVDHSRLVTASYLLQAIPLRTEGRLQDWQGELSRYPSGLQERLVDAATEFWAYPRALAARWAIARRGQQLALYQPARGLRLQGTLSAAYSSRRRPS